MGFQNCVRSQKGHTTATAAPSCSAQNPEWDDQGRRPGCSALHLLGAVGGPRAARYQGRRRTASAGVRDGGKRAIAGRADDVAPRAYRWPTCRGRGEPMPSLTPEVVVCAIVVSLVARSPPSRTRMTFGPPSLRAVQARRRCPPASAPRTETSGAQRDARALVVAHPAGPTHTVCPGASWRYELRHARLVPPRPRRAAKRVVRHLLALAEVDLGVNDVVPPVPAPRRVGVAHGHEQTGDWAVVLAINAITQPLRRRYVDPALAGAANAAGPVARDSPRAATRAIAAAAKRART